MTFQIALVFNWLAENDAKEKEALTHLKEYIVVEHPKMFCLDTKHKILKTCEKITHVTHGIHKKENKILHEIKNIFNS